MPCERFDYIYASNRLVEERYEREGEGLVSWIRNVYASDGFLAKQFSLNDDGTVISWVEFHRRDNPAFETGYSAFSKEGKLEYIREYKYDFNERGDWISRVSMNDGKPMWRTDREIHYFD